MVLWKALTLWMSHIPFTTKRYIIIVLEGDMLFAIARGTMTF
jgi:hypothetical protein